MVRILAISAAGIIASAVFGLNCCGGELYMHAHRGEASIAPQNTRESIKLAYDLGARMIETDCHLTEEGEMIIMHGRKEAKEVWGLDKDPKTITLKEVKNSRLAHPEKYDAKYANCRIPTLDELFAVMPKDKFMQWVEEHTGGAI